MKENSFKFLLNTTNKFGNYQIEGNLLLLGVVINKSVQSFLYLNCDDNIFLIVKKYISGKYHIDFLTRIDNQKCLYHRDNVCMGDNVDIAVCFQKDHTKTLHYSWDNDAYVLDSVSESKTYQTIFWKGIKND